MQSPLPFVFSLALPLWLVSSPDAAAVNVLVDGGFETTLTTDGAPFVGTWEGFSSASGSASFGTAMARGGAQSLTLAISGVANEFAGAFQDVVGLTAGQDVTYSGWHKLSGDVGGSEIRIEWRNSGSDSEVSRTQITPTGGADFELFTLSDTVPAGADSARVVYAIQSFGGAVNQQVFVDDVSFDAPIPEPGTFALLGSGVLVLLMRRRRK